MVDAWCCAALTGPLDGSGPCRYTVTVGPARATWGPKEADRLLPSRDTWYNPASAVSQ